MISNSLFDAGAAAPVVVKHPNIGNYAPVNRHLLIASIAIIVLIPLVIVLAMNVFAYPTDAPPDTSGYYFRFYELPLAL
jgi:hypothetical protein